MMDVETMVERANALPEAIGGDLQGFGGILRCTVCGREQPVGDVGAKLRHGWPKCCGYTMTWVTQRLLDEEAEGIGQATTVTERGDDA